MRVKQLWSYVPLPQSLRLVWDRLTFSRLTTIYFVVALIHCFIQVIFQISALYINQDAAHVLANIASIDPNTPAGYAILVQDGPLRACTGMPGSTGSTPCQMVWSGKVAPDAFGDHQYYYNETDDQSMATNAATTSAGTSAVSSSVSAAIQVSTVVVTASASGSSTASNTAVQTQATTSRLVPDSTVVTTSLTSTAPSPTSSTTSVATSPSTSNLAGRTPRPEPSDRDPDGRRRPEPSDPAPSPPPEPSDRTPRPPRPEPSDRAPARRMYIPAHTPGSQTHTFSKRDLGITPVFSQFDGTFQGVKLSGLSVANYAGSSRISTDGAEAFISNVCVHALQWPLQKLWNTQREDAVFIGFQFWVLGMSVVALLNESVPHIIAAFLTHLLATAWSAFQIAHTANFRSGFSRLTTRGACGGVNLLPTYWQARANAEIPILVLNAVVLIASAYMSWRLLKTFGWLTFKRVGASLEINRVYRVVLCLSIVLQLSLYFMVVSMALWIEQMYNGPGAGRMALAPLYKAIVAIQLVALVPWLVMGWYAVRREMRKVMIAFITLSALYIAAWAGMFVSTTWRLTFLTWMFFRIMSVNAATLSVLTLGLGIICLLNFGKGLPNHLRMIEDPEGADFEPALGPSSDPEKNERVDFPAQNTYPTYSVAFPSRSNSMTSGSSHTRSESADSMPPLAIAHLPPVKKFEVERPMSNGSVHDPFEHDLARVTSNNTYPTVRSVASNYSADAAPAARMGKRWFIE